MSSKKQDFHVTTFSFWTLLIASLIKHPSVLLLISGFYSRESVKADIKRSPELRTFTDVFRDANILQMFSKT